MTIAHVPLYCGENLSQMCALAFNEAAKDLRSSEVLENTGSIDSAYRWICDWRDRRNTIFDLPDVMTRHAVQKNHDLLYDTLDTAFAEFAAKSHLDLNADISKDRFISIALETLKWRRWRTTDPPLSPLLLADFLETAAKRLEALPVIPRFL